jgi:hypothetical protein
MSNFSGAEFVYVGDESMEQVVVVLATPNATPDDVKSLYTDIETSIVTPYYSEYTIDWVPVKPAPGLNNQAAEPSSTFVVKQGNKEVFRASQTSANFNTPIDINILKAYLTAMKDKMPVILVNDCANFELAQQLLKVADGEGVKVKVEFTEKAIATMTASAKAAGDDDFSILRKIADLPKYKSESVNTISHNKSSQLN